MMSRSNDWHGKKRGKDRNKKIWISLEWKEPFRPDKNHFSKFLSFSKKWKIVDTTFNYNWNKM